MLLLSNFMLYLYKPLQLKVSDASETFFVKLHSKVLIDRNAQVTFSHEFVTAIQWDPQNERVALCTGNNKLYFWSVAGCVTVDVPTESEGLFAQYNAVIYTISPVVLLDRMRIK